MKTDWRHLSEVLWERSGHGCEHCGCGLASPDHAHRHHRKLRSAGGQHTIPNLLLLCSLCHQRAHARPTMAKHEGTIVPSWGQPERVPVFHALHGLVWLLPDGTVSQEVPEAA